MAQWKLPTESSLGESTGPLGELQLFHVLSMAIFNFRTITVPVTTSFVTPTNAWCYTEGELYLKIKRGGGRKRSWTPNSGQRLKGFVFLFFLFNNVIRKERTFEKEHLKVGMKGWHQATMEFIVKIHSSRRAPCPSSAGCNGWEAGRCDGVTWSQPRRPSTSLHPTAACSADRGLAVSVTAPGLPGAGNPSPGLRARWAGRSLSFQLSGAQWLHLKFAPGAKRMLIPLSVGLCLQSFCHVSPLIILTFVN